MNRTSHHFFKIFLLFAIIIFPFSAFADNSTPVFSSPKNKIIVTPEQPEFTIILKSNPTTGFSWKIATIDSSMFTNLGHQYIAPNTKVMGAPGYEVWKFKAIYPTTHAFAVNQVGHVVMEYKRPWTKDKKETTVYHFTVVMKKK